MPVGQVQQRVNVGLLEQFAEDGFARPSFEQHVVRQHDRRAAVLLEDGENVLEKIELLVASGAQRSSRLVGYSTVMERLQTICIFGCSSNLSRRTSLISALIIFLGT